MRLTLLATIVLYLCLCTYFAEIALHYKLTTTTGLSLSNLSIYLMILYWWVKAGNTKEIIKPSSINTWLVAFTLVMLLSIPIKLITQEITLEDIGPDLISFKSLLVNSFLYYFLFYNIIDSKKVAHRVLCGLVIVGIASGVLSILAAKGIIIDKSKMSIQGRVMGFSEPNQYAAFLAMIIPATLAQIIKENGFITKAFFMSGFLILFWALILSGSRGSFVALVLGLLCFLILSQREKLIKPLNIIMIGGLIIGGCVVLIAFSPVEFREGMSKRLIFSESGDFNKFTSGRIKLIGNGIDLFAQSPIYGHGYNTYIEENIKQFKTYALSHNEYLALIVEQGIMGLIIYIVINVKILSNSNKALKFISNRGDKIVLISMMSGVISYMIAIAFVNIIDVKKIFWAYVAILLSINYYAFSKVMFNKQGDNETGVNNATLESTYGRS